MSLHRLNWVMVATMKLAVPLWSILSHLIWFSVVNTKCNLPETKPNFIFIITDDQDLHLQSLVYQPLVRKHFAEQGTTYRKHYCTVSQCCPSRVSLLTGRAAHNTNVTDVVAPYGKSCMTVCYHFSLWFVNRWISQICRRRMERQLSSYMATRSGL